MTSTFAVVFDIHRTKANYRLLGINAQSCASLLRVHWVEIGRWNAVGYVVKRISMPEYLTLLCLLHQPTTGRSDAQVAVGNRFLFNQERLPAQIFVRRFRQLRTTTTAGFEIGTSFTEMTSAG